MPMVRLKIGVMGSALDEPKAAESAREIGQAIAESGCILITGGSAGVPYEAVKSAKKHGGMTVGVSPAMNAGEHTSVYKLPTEDFDILIFTGFERKGRNVISIRSCDGVIFISGGTGTLNEFTIAYDEGKVCGILVGTGGISDGIKDFEERYLSGRKKSGKVIYDSDTKRLVESVISELK